MNIDIMTLNKVDAFMTQKVVEGLLEVETMSVAKLPNKDYSPVNFVFDVIIHNYNSSLILQFRARCGKTVAKINALFEYAKPDS